jgi:WD40 repeat protein
VEVLQTNVRNSIDGSLISTLLGHGSQIASFAVLKNGNLASAFYDGVIEIWNVTYDSLIKNISSETAVLQNCLLASGDTLIF